VSQGEKNALSVESVDKDIHSTGNFFYEKTAKKYVGID
jgi:hypothetical protein